MKVKKTKKFSKRVYEKTFNDIRNRIIKVRQTVVSYANRELIMLYWEIGRIILLRQKNEGWGAKIIDRMSCDISFEFPEMKGFSVRNLKYMLKFAVENSSRAIVQQVVAQLPWGSNIALLDKLNNQRDRKK